MHPRRLAPQLGALVLILASAASGLPERLQLASDVWPPFTDVEGRVQVAAELVEAALRRSGVTVTTEVRSDFTQVLRELRAGEVDGSPALWRDAAREEFLLFSRPYLENRLVLLARRGTDVSAASPSDLAGKRVAVVEGYSYGGALDVVPGPELVHGPSDQRNLQRLLAGEVDYLLADELLIHDLFERYGERARKLLSVGTEPILQRALHLAVRRDLSDAEAIIAAFDETIGDMIADGSYNRILGITWIRADLDGDGTVEFVLGGKRAGTAPPEDGYDIFGPTEQAEPAGRRYVIEGKMYESWQQVPPEYRVREEPESETPRAGILLFEF
jgi:ABC-type amino acid transport substrate-binding protein